MVPVVKEINNKEVTDSEKKENLVTNRMMIAFAGVFLLVYGMITLGRFPDKKLYFSILPVCMWIAVGLFAASLILFVIRRVRKTDESEKIFRSYVLMAFFAVLFGGFTLWRFMKVNGSQLIVIFIFFAVLYFLCSIFADKVKMNFKK